MSAVSADDVWAVGELLGDGGPDGKLIMHWNGTAWHRLAVDGHRFFDRFLDGVDAVSATDVWAVGERGNRQFDTKGLVMHYDGTGWSHVPSPQPAGVVLYGVSASSATDAWAVGQSSLNPSGYSRPLAFHWDGNRWTRFATHDSVEADYLMGVMAVSPDDAWAVGNGRIDQGLIEHRDGARWTVVQNPRGGPLSEVDASAPDDVWAVGMYKAGGTQRDLMAHWDGTSWTVVDGADPGRADPGPSDVYDLAPDDVWAVGGYNDFNAPLAEHWNGSRWTLP